MYHLFGTALTSFALRYVFVIPNSVEIGGELSNVNALAIIE